MSSQYEITVNPDTQEFIVYPFSDEGFKAGETICTLEFIIDRHQADGLPNGEYEVDIVDIFATDENGDDMDIFSASAGYITVATEYELGDINFDGVVSNEDIIAIARYLVNLVEFNEAQMIQADVDEDGEIDNSDLIKVVRSVVEK